MLESVVRVYPRVDVVLQEGALGDISLVHGVVPVFVLDRLLARLLYLYSGIDDAGGDVLTCE